MLVFYVLLVNHPFFSLHFQIHCLRVFIATLLRYSAHAM